MSPVFIRSDQIQELVFDVKLRIPEWKVLFAVDGKMDARELAEFLEMQESSVSATLKKLQELNLLTLINNGQVSETEVVKDAAATVEEAEEETAESEVTEAEDEEAEIEESDIEFSIEEEEEKAEELTDEAELQEPPLETEAEEAETFAESEDEILAEEPDSSEEVSVSEEAEPGEEEAEPGEEENLDELIGNLLDDESLESEETEAVDETVEVTPDTEKERGEEDFDLGTMFEDEISDTEESLSEMLGDVEEETIAPAAEVAETPPLEEAETEKLEPTHTILVVDDSVVIRKMVEIALENERYDIVAVATGKDALKYLDDHNPDLIILDIMLSDVNGLDVLKAIKAGKDIPVVMLSAKDTPRETSKAKQLGADDFIPKPFKDEELVAKVKELIKA